MTFALFMRQWAAMAVGGTLLAVGMVILLTNLPIADGWTEYARASGMAFYPGLSSAHGTARDVGGNPLIRYASLTGQITIGLGAALLVLCVSSRVLKRS